jgi:hypothetical protein
LFEVKSCSKLFVFHNGVFKVIKFSFDTVY